MTKLAAELLNTQLAKQIWYTVGRGNGTSHGLRVTLQSEGEGEDVLRLRDMAARSLMGQS